MRLTCLQNILLIIHEYLRMGQQSEGRKLVPPSCLLTSIQVFVSPHHTHTHTLNNCKKKKKNSSVFVLRQALTM